MRRLFLAAAFLFFGTIGALAQTPIVTKHEDAPPEQLEDVIDAVVAVGGEQVAVGSKTLEFWWVKSLPLRADSGEISWASVEEGTLVGVVDLSAPYPDVRGTTMKAGVYTLRYGIQPADGNHIGVSEHREFLLLSPAEMDSTAAARSHDAAVTIAKLSTGAHPPSWSLDPPIASEAPLSIRDNGSGMKAVVFSVPVSRDGNDVGTLSFALVLVGAVRD